MKIYSEKFDRNALYIDEARDANQCAFNSFHCHTSKSYHPRLFSNTTHSPYLKFFNPFYTY